MLQHERFLAATGRFLLSCGSTEYWLGVFLGVTYGDPKRGMSIAKKTSTSLVLRLLREEFEQLTSVELKDAVLADLTRLAPLRELRNSLAHGFEFSDEGWDKPWPRVHRLTRRADVRPIDDLTPEDLEAKTRELEGCMKHLWEAAWTRHDEQLATLNATRGD